MLVAEKVPTGRHTHRHPSSIGDQTSVIASLVIFRDATIWHRIICWRQGVGKALELLVDGIVGFGNQKPAGIISRMRSEGGA